MVVPTGAALAQPAISRAALVRAHTAALHDAATRGKLADDALWRRLGHWRGDDPFSSADGDAFFLSPTGRDDPDAELHATIDALFAPVPPPQLVTPTDAAGRAVGPPRPATPGEVQNLPEIPVAQRHALCRFPARLLFLRARAGLDPRLLPAAHCPRMMAFFQSLRPASATMVFSAYHVSAPASAFGHTFLRINRAPHTREGTGAGQTRGEQLLDTGVGFAAAADTGNAVLYAIKGMFGGFKGEFTAIPYYYKVREYNDFESRDLWEYDLDLRPDELLRMVAHIWELGATHFDYYYASENCSFLMLALLDVAWPNAKLAEQARWPVVPADTLKVALAVPGRLLGVRYRPSLATQFLRRVAILSGDERAAVATLADAPDADGDALGWATWDKARRAAVLDAAMDLFDMRHIEAVLVGPDHPLADRAVLAGRDRLLQRRAALAVGSPDAALAGRPDARPDEGHDSMRLELAGGASAGYRVGGDGGGSVQSALAGTAATETLLGYRLALHSLEDPSRGYPRLSTLTFFPTRLRVQTGLGSAARTPRLRVEQASIADAANLRPVSRFAAPLSWRFRVGAIERTDEARYGGTAGQLHLGGGVTFGTSDESLAVYALADTELRVGRGLRMHRAVPFAVGLGGTAGVRIDWGGRGVTTLSAQSRWWPLQDDPWTWGGQLEQAQAISRNAALWARWRVDEVRHAGLLGVRWYF